MSHRSQVMHVENTRGGVGSFSLSVAAIVLILSFVAVPAGLTKPSPALLYGEVKATTAKTIQVQVADRVLPVSAEVTIRDEEGYTRRPDQVYRGVQVVLHLEKGEIVGMTLLAD